MSWLGGVLASAMTYIFQSLLRDLIAYIKKMKEEHDIKVAIKQKTTDLIAAVKVAKTPEDMQHAAKAIADYIANLPPR